MGAVFTISKIDEAFTNGMEYFNTFGGNQVSSSVGIGVLDIMKKKGLKQNALEIVNWLKEKLERLKEYFELIEDVRGEGFFLGVELVLDPEKRESAPLQADYVVERVKSINILLSSEGP